MASPRRPNNIKVWTTLIEPRGRWGETDLVRVAITSRTKTGAAVRLGVSSLKMSMITEIEDYSSVTKLLADGPLNVYRLSGKKWIKI